MIHSDRLRSIVTLLAILSTFIVNVWSNLYPPNGLSIGDISNTFFRDVLIIPANYAFAIWGLIYLGLIALGIYQILPAQQHNSRLRRTGYGLAIASIAQIIWVLLFQNRQFFASIAAMLGILIPLIVVYLRLGINIAPQPLRERPSRLERWLVDIPISIYLGWISVATIVNVASALADAGWNRSGSGAIGWTLIMLVVAAAIAAIVALRRDTAFVLVIVWAFVAIAVRQAAQKIIAVPAVGLAIGLVLLLVWVLNRPKRIYSR